MPASTDHPVFQQPENSHERIWRYMDFTKFVSLLHTKGLFFCRADKLGDPFEGSIPEPTYNERPSHFETLLTAAPKNEIGPFIENWSKFRRWQREWTYVNCWHMSNHEYGGPVCQDTRITIFR